MLISILKFYIKSHTDRNIGRNGNLHLHIHPLDL